MKKCPVVLSFVLFVLVSMLASPCAAVMSRAQKRYNLVILLCDQVKSNLSIMNASTDFFVEDKKVRREAQRQVEALEQKIIAIKESTVSQQSRIKTAGKDFLKSELMEVASLDKGNNWGELMEKAVDTEAFEKDPARMAKALIFVCAVLEDVRAGMPDLFDLATEPKHSAEIGRLKDLVASTKPSIKSYLKEAKAIGKKRLSVDEMKAEMENFRNKLTPVMAVMAGAAARFNQIYFEEFDQEDFSLE
jgi:hypothetical protein